MTWMTNSYAIIRAIAKIQDMTPAERWAGALIAVHLNTKANQIKIRQSVLAEESGLKERCIRKAVAKMVAAGLFSKARTQTGIVLIPASREPPETPGGSVKRSVNMHRHERAGPTGTYMPDPTKKMPWDYDLEHSTRAEEEFKRGEAQFALERAGGNG